MVKEKKEKNLFLRLQEELLLNIRTGFISHLTKAKLLAPILILS